MLPIHAPTLGVISAIERRTVAHPSGLSELCIVQTPDQQEEWFEMQPQPDFQQLPLKHCRSSSVRPVSQAWSAQAS